MPDELLDNPQNPLPVGYGPDWPKMVKEKKEGLIGRYLPSNNMNLGNLSEHQVRPGGLTNPVAAWGGCRSQAKHTSCREQSRVNAT